MIHDRPSKTWPRNVLFLSLCLFGAGSLAVSLLPTNRLPEPAGFDPERATKNEFGRVVRQVDEEFRAHWRLSGVAPASRAPDLLIARRLSLGLAGTVPSLEEIRALENQPPEHRVEWWVSHLLEDRRTAEHVAERLARAFVGVEGGPFLVYRRRRFVTWLADRLQANTPYDELARMLIDSDGLWTDSPAVNFTTVTISDDSGKQPDPKRLAARTSRAFLGMRIDCLQCHDNNLTEVFPLGSGPDVHDGTQRDFHQLAAFFAEANVEIGGVHDRNGEPYRFQFLHEDEPAAVEARFPYLDDLPVPGRTERERLANWVTHPANKPFARAAVNRVWALLFGQPLTAVIDNIPLYGYPTDDRRAVERAAALVTGNTLAMPVDDVPSLRFATGRDKTRWWSGDDPFPPGMEALADDFIQHGYDLRRLIRLIAATEVFQRDGTAEFDAVDERDQRLATFPATRLRPEQFSGALVQACSLTTIDSSANIITRLQKDQQTAAFIKRYGDTGEDEFAHRGGTIPQRLLILNGQLVHNRSQVNRLLTNASSQILALAPNDEKVVEIAFLALLTRRPFEDESAYFEDLLRGAGGGARKNVVEDMFWALLNFSEFEWNY